MDDNKQHQKNKLKDYPIYIDNKYWTVYLNTKEGRQINNDRDTLRIN